MGSIMQPARRWRVRAGASSALCLALTGCQPVGSTGAPSIAFTEVPAASEGGSEKLAPIGGRVTGARAGQKIVLFAKSGVVGVCHDSPVHGHRRRLAGRTASTRHRLRGAARRVRIPSATTEPLPAAGGPIRRRHDEGHGHLPAAAAQDADIQLQNGRSVRRRATAAARTTDPANAWIDADGALHLKVAADGDSWTSAEVAMTRSLGYGTYVFVVRDVAHVDPAVALSLLTWYNQGIDQNHRELDIELSRWGDPNSKNAQYVVQPYYVAANVMRFETPPGRLTHSVRWEPGRASFKTVRGSGSGSDARLPVIAQHDFTSGVPVPGNETVRMNLYYFRYAPTPLARESEIVIGFSTRRSRTIRRSCAMRRSSPLDGRRLRHHRVRARPAARDVATITMSGITTGFPGGHVYAIAQSSDAICGSRANEDSHA
jgi:hypothetical protein